MRRDDIVFCATFFPGIFLVDFWFLCPQAFLAVLLGLLTIALLIGVLRLSRLSAALALIAVLMALGTIQALVVCSFATVVIRLVYRLFP